MGETLQEQFDPIERMALLSYVFATHGNQVAAAKKSPDRADHQLAMAEARREIYELKEQFSISEEDFFEVTFQPEGWRDRIAYGRSQEAEIKPVKEEEA